MREPDKIKAQGSAYKLLLRYAQIDSAPVKVDAIAIGEGMDFEVGTLSGCDARLIRSSPSSGFARISNRINELGKVRFTLAHELGHYTMHSGDSQVKACSDGDLADYRRNPMEVEANIFASEILMPKRIFEELARKTGPTFAEIGKLAKAFNVSLTAAIIRYIDIGPVNEMTLVYISPDRRVKWSKSRWGNWCLWVDEGMQIPRSSMASCAFLDKDGVDPTELHPCVWFRGIYEHQMTEECLYMPEYGAVLSLLVLEPE